MLPFTIPVLGVSLKAERRKPKPESVGVDALSVFSLKYPAFSFQFSAFSLPFCWYRASIRAVCCRQRFPFLSADYADCGFGFLKLPVRRAGYLSLTLLDDGKAEMVTDKYLIIFDY